MARVRLLCRRVILVAGGDIYGEGHLSAVDEASACDARSSMAVIAKRITHGDKRRPS